MDDIMVRSRYPRHSVPSRRRSRYGREKSRLPRLIARQFLVCLVIFLVILLIKSINTPFTNYISDNVKYVLEQEIELGSIFNTVDNALGKLTDKDNGNSNDMDITDIQNEPDAAKPAPSVLSASTEDGSDFAYNMTVPVDGVLSSPFGERKDPITGVSKMHEGIDVEAANGEIIVAALGGTVIDAGSSPSYGKYLRIRHGGGFETVYAHCSSVSVQQGQKVAQGDLVARVGNTGASVGTHLHFEIWKDGRAVNPLEYIAVPLP